MKTQGVLKKSCSYICEIRFRFRKTLINDFTTRSLQIKTFIFLLFIFDYSLKFHANINFR